MKKKVCLSFNTRDSNYGICFDNEPSQATKDHFCKVSSKFVQLFELKPLHNMRNLLFIYIY